MPDINLILQTLEPVDFANIAAYAYEHGPLPRNTTYLDEMEISGVRLVYLGMTLPDNRRIGILSVRGTVANVGCYSQDAFIALPSGDFAMSHGLRSLILVALLRFERIHPKCVFATGHSLGGKYLDGLPEHILGVAFNGFRNSFRKHVISFRVRGDIADIGNTNLISHTDEWIWSHTRDDEKPMPEIFRHVHPLLSGLAAVPSLECIEAHKLTTMITSLKVEKIKWGERYHVRANITLPGYTVSTTQAPPVPDPSILAQAQGAYVLLNAPGGAQALFSSATGKPPDCSIM